MRFDGREPEEVKERREVVGDPFVTQFLKMKPAQIDAWVNANTVNLSQVRVVLRMIVKLLVLLARKAG